MSLDQQLSQQIESIVLARIAADKLVLATWPTAAMAAMELLRDRNASYKAIAATIEKDPTLVLQVLRTANAAAYGGGSAIKTMEQALSRLGTQKTRTLLTEVCARKCFESRDSRIQKASAGLWEHSLAVGILARDLASLSGSADADDAYLAGLLHDVGKPIVAIYLLETEKIAASNKSRWVTPEAWMKIVHRTHRKIGVAAVEKWQLAPAIQAAVRDCGDYDAADRNSIANFVRFANAIVKQQGIYVGPVDAEDNNALIMVGRTLLGIEDEVIQRLLADLADRVHKHSQ